MKPPSKKLRGAIMGLNIGAAILCSVHPNFGDHSIALTWLAIANLACAGFHFGAILQES